jgi:hypothetical protein
MESLAGQVEKLKEVGKALVSKKESEIQTLKKEIAELNEDKNVRYHRTPPSLQLPTFLIFMRAAPQEGGGGIAEGAAAQGRDGRAR